jgi:hypothetical protein
MKESLLFLYFLDLSTNHQNECLYSEHKNDVPIVLIESWLMREMAWLSSLWLVNLGLCLGEVGKSTYSCTDLPSFYLKM